MKSFKLLLVLNKKISCNIKLQEISIRDALSYAISFAKVTSSVKPTIPS